MPITAKLSKAFYEKVGEQATNELIDWFNQVDATYRADLRALNDQNFARFDTKLEQRIEVLRAQLEGKLEATKFELIKRMFVFWTGTVLADKLLP